MQHQRLLTLRYIRKALVFLLLVAGSSIITIAIAEEEHYSSWIFTHNDYKLVWYYNTKKDFEANHPNRVFVNTKEFYVRPDVRPPTINGIYLLEHSKVNQGEAVLDLGTGTGLHAIYAAERTNRVVATDIYAPAIVNAKTNARHHNVEDNIDFRVGDLFAPIKDTEKFDVIFVNINYPFAVGDNDRNRLHERLFSEVGKYMNPDARIYYQTSFIKNIPYIYDLLDRNGFNIVEMHMEYLLPSKHEPLFFTVKKR